MSDMTYPETVLVVAVLLWAAWLIWNGRYNSPQHKQRRADFDYLCRLAALEREERKP